ncbi:hypothetical protein [Algoriphagus sp.]|uniref:hypothetical protein n=1 Tax=Algoriphagus sp. TaxID=1872435 RepID=UPI003F6F8977
MKRFKNTVMVMTSILGLMLMLSCSGNDEDGKPDAGKESHAYDITMEGGEKFSGEVPKEVFGGTYNPVMFVGYNEDIDGELLTGLLMDTGKFQFGIGLALGGNNQPSIVGNGPGLVFGEWGTEDKYKPAGPVSMTLKNYKEHDVSMYGEEGTAASFTLEFSGKFQLGDEGESVDVTGEVFIAAP